MPDHKELLEVTLSTLYEKDSSAVASRLYNEDGSLKDDAFDAIKEWDVERVGSIRGSLEDIKKEHYHRGLRVANEEVEKVIKKNGVKSDKKGAELVAEVLAQKLTPQELTPEAIKLHPLYQGLENQLTSKETEWETKLKAERDAWTAESQRTHTLTEISNLALAKAEALKVAGLPKDPAKRPAFLASVLGRLAGHEYQVQEDNGKRTFLPKSKDGGRLEDAHGAKIPIEKLIEGYILEAYELDTDDGRSAHQGGSNGVNKAAWVDIPKDPAERLEWLYKFNNDPSVTPERRKAVLEALKNQK